MRASIARSAAAATQRKPLIHFIGKRTTLSSHSFLPLDCGTRLFHVSGPASTSLHKHKQRTPKHMNLDTIRDENDTLPNDNLADDDVGREPLPESTPRSNAMKSTGKQPRRAYSYADSVYSDGATTHQLAALPPLMIRDDGDDFPELLHQTTNVTTPGESSKPLKRKRRPRVKWEPRPEPVSPTPIISPIASTSQSPSSWSPFTPESTTTPTHMRKYIPPTAKTRAKWRRRRHRARANSKLRAERKRTPKIYRRVFGPWRDDVHIQRYMPKSIILTPPHRPTSVTRLRASLPGSKKLKVPKVPVPRSRLPDNDQLVEGVDKVLEPLKQERERLERVLELRAQARLAVSRIVNFGKLLKGSGRAYPSRPPKWKRS